MSCGITSMSTIKALLHHKHMYMLGQLCTLSIKHKRKVYQLLRTHLPKHGIHNVLFPEYNACTLSEFCLSHIVISENRKKYTEFIARELK